MKTIDKITNINPLDFGKQYTYADYVTWQFSERLELIKGWLHKMSPAPWRWHKDVEIYLSSKIWSYFEKKPCKVYQSAFDVRLKGNKSKNNEIDTVVQPDVCVVCNLAKPDDTGCLGAPDWSIEILSESTAKKDYNDKFNLYEANGIKEYWIVGPDTRTIEIYSLQNNTYELQDTPTRQN